MVMKKMGILARARGEVRSATREPASRDPVMTQRAAYLSLDISTDFALSLGRRFMAGMNSDSAHAESQTMEHSMGVTLMLRNTC